LNGFRLHQLSPPTQFAFWQEMALEDPIHGLKIKFCRHIHHRKIFIIERFMGFRRIPIAFDQMGEIAHMGIDMAAWIHRHESAKL